MFTLADIVQGGGWGEAQRRLLITFVVCLVVMLPVPYWVFNGCRVKYRLRNRVLSRDVGVMDESIGMQSDDVQLDGGAANRPPHHPRQQNRDSST